MQDVALTKRKRFLLILPLIICPFLVLIFWLLGGGRIDSVEATPLGGLNYQLPDAKVKEISAMDKLSFYTLAKQDSLKRLELEQLDPLYEKTAIVAEERDVDRQYMPVYQPRPLSTPYPYYSKSTTELDQLDSLVQTLQQPQKDLELTSLNQTLQQLVALQQPTSNAKVMVNQPEVFSVRVGSDLSTSGFYGESVSMADSVNGDLIHAVVHGAQQVQHGSTLKLRLLQDVFIQHEKIPFGTFLFGQVSLDQERLQILIRSIPCRGQLYPVSLSVFDIDGMAGIHIPGSLEREVMKQSADQAVQSVGIVGMGTSLPSQVAAAGIGTAKNLLGRKLRQVRVTIKAGYQVLLKDEKRREW